MKARIVARVVLTVVAVLLLLLLLAGWVLDFLVCRKYAPAFAEFRADTSSTVDAFSAAEKSLASDPFFTAVRAGHDAAGPLLNAWPGTSAATLPPGSPLALPADI